MSESSDSVGPGHIYDVEAVSTKNPVVSTVNNHMSREEMLSRESFSDSAVAVSQNPAASTKGILQTNKPLKTWQVSNLDQEKFVRFGE